MKIYEILPDNAPMAAITLFQRVFAKKDVGPVTLQHEAVHVAQQKRDGWKFYWRYAFRPKWRVEYEAEAYSVDYKAGVSLDRIATWLSGKLYLWPCTYEEAKYAVLREVGTPKNS